MTGRTTTTTGGPRALIALAVLGALLLAGCGSDDGDQAAGGSDASSGATSSGAPAGDNAALDAGAAWLADQVQQGTIHNDQYDTDDQGLAVDVALALHAVGAEPETVDAVARHLADHLDAYLAPGFGTLTSAGSTAKAAVLFQELDQDPGDVHGTDLVASLEDTVRGSGPAAGRVEDQLDPKTKKAADYANVVAQAYAVTALRSADSDESGAATDYLLAQQCPDGWFRLELPAPSAADQSCDPRDAKPDLDATAFAVGALAGSDDPEAQDAVERGVDWLAGVQADDGSFGGEPVGGTPNANSTGLAGRVLAGAGQDPAAQRAAAWVAEHQLGCRAGQRSAGAIAYDDASLATARRAGITADVQDQFRRATAQALPALQWLPSEQTGAASGC